MRVLICTGTFALLLASGHLLPAAGIERLPPVPLHWSADQEPPPARPSLLAHHVADEVSGPFDGYYGYDGKYHHPPIAGLKTFIGADSHSYRSHGRRH